MAKSVATALFIVCVLCSGQARGGPLIGHAAGASGYSPWHYRTPQLYRWVRAHRTPSSYLAATTNPYVPPTYPFTISSYPEVPPAQSSPLMPAPPESRLPAATSPR